MVLLRAINHRPRARTSLCFQTAAAGSHVETEAVCGASGAAELFHSPTHKAAVCQCGNRWVTHNSAQFSRIPLFSSSVGFIVFPPARTSDGRRALCLRSSGTSGNWWLILVSPEPAVILPQPVQRPSVALWVVSVRT